MNKRFLAIILCVVTLCLLSVGAFAAEHDYVSSSGNWGDIEDNAHLFDNTDGIMKNIEYVTQYTNLLVYTTDYNATSASGMAASLAKDRFGYESGIVFLIDMDNRYIYIYAHNDAYDKITPVVADTITDNVYNYASDKKYEKCAEVALAQIYAKLSGKRIPEPMRYIGNAFLAVMLGVGFAAVWACYASRIQVSGLVVKDVKVTTSDKDSRVIDTKRTRHTSSSSGGGGRSGGGGGGGSRGGGGGHRF